MKLVFGAMKLFNGVFAAFMDLGGLPVLLTVNPGDIKMFQKNENMIANLMLTSCERKDCCMCMCISDTTILRRGWSIRNSTCDILWAIPKKWAGVLLLHLCACRDSMVIFLYQVSKRNTLKKLWIRKCLNFNHEKETQSSGNFWSVLGVYKRSKVTKMLKFNY